MSRKSNAFQKTILFIHQQLENSDAVVTESYLLEEINIKVKVKREIDILIEKVINGVTRRIAIECRDRSAKDDIIWIDGLMGKFQNLNVDKVIAVSSSGFSKNAKLKAESNNIELRTINEIESMDWNSEFIKVGMVDWRIEFNIKSILAETIDNKSIQLRGTERVIYKEEQGTFKEFFDIFKQTFWNDKFKDKFDGIREEIYKVKEDLTKIAKITYRVPIHDVKIVVNDSDETISALILNIDGIPLVKNLRTNQFNYEESVISKTNLEINDNESLTFYTSQTKSTNLLNVSIDPKKKKKY